jgi:hypothetical protein
MSRESGSKSREPGTKSHSEERKPKGLGFQTTTTEIGSSPTDLLDVYHIYFTISYSERELTLQIAQFLYTITSIINRPNINAPELIRDSRNLQSVISP